MEKHGGEAWWRSTVEKHGGLLDSLEIDRRTGPIGDGPDGDKQMETQKRNFKLTRQQWKPDWATRKKRPGSTTTQLVLHFGLQLHKDTNINKQKDFQYLSKILVPTINKSQTWSYDDNYIWRNETTIFVLEVDCNLNNCGLFADV